VQGDEPLIPPALVGQVATNLGANPSAAIATLSEPITDLNELTNSNAVKVVTDSQGMALYFSRAVIPWPREAFVLDQAAMPAGSWFRHIGIYAYRVGFLHRYVTWASAPMEQLEQLEQLRALYNGERIHVDLASETVPGGVDTAEDLQAVRRLMENRND
jgi:3-deoxy-manno-octulosonate cytidylyltransferase (CMP-KDO synthetase)